MKRPSLSFYPDDWLTDLGLRQCPPAARGIWMDLLCLMHQGEPYGHLSSKNGQLTEKYIASVCGVSVKELRPALACLETNGVFSRATSGAIYSRRMVKDEHNRIVRAAGGPLSAKHPKVPPKDTFPEEVRIPSKHQNDPILRPVEVKEEVCVYASKKGYEWFKSEYPPFRFDERLTAGLWVSVVDSIEVELKIRSHLPRAKRSRQWVKDGGDGVPLASNYLSKRNFEMEPGPEMAEKKGFVHDEAATILARNLARREELKRAERERNQPGKSA